MRKSVLGWRWWLAAWLMLSPGVAFATEVSDLEQFLRKAAKDPAVQPVEVFTARQKLGQLYADMGDARRAEAVWRDTVKLFAKSTEEKDGGITASIAAEAAYRLLEPKATAFVATPLTLPGKMPPDKALQQLMSQLQKQLVFVRGSADMDPEGLNEAGGVCGDLIAQVDLYRSADWTYAAAILRARLLGHVSESAAELPLPDGLPEAKGKQVRGLMTLVSARMRQLAEGALTAAWADAQRRGVQSARVNELKRELNRFKPAEFPLSRERARTWLEPTDAGAQAELGKALDLEIVRACFDRHMASHPDQMLGELNLSLTIDDTGRAGEIEVKGESAVVAECVHKRWRGLADLPHGTVPRLVHVRLQYAAF
jgi:hypothetical protein